MHEAYTFGQPNGNGAWRSLIDWFETRDSNELMALSIERAISDIKYTDADTQTIGVSLTVLMALSTNTLNT